VQHIYLYVSGAVHVAAVVLQFSPTVPQQYLAKQRCALHLFFMHCYRAHRCLSQHRAAPSHTLKVACIWHTYKVELWRSALCKGKLSTTLLALISFAYARPLHSTSNSVSIGKICAGFVERAKLHLPHEEPAERG
jgi:hypothetical protein